MSTAEFPANNKTWQILHKARKEGYGVGAFNCYNNDGVMAIIRAAEAKKSPAIIQLFPWTMHFQGPAFIRYVAEAARMASVPIALHIDHCIKVEDVQTALSLPIDSIMVDASSAGGELNCQYCAEVVRQARPLGITVEAEVGRIDGSEDGLPRADVEAALTDPEEARAFVAKSGVHFLAPSFGNIHGPYPAEGAEGSWQLDRRIRLESISQKVGPDVPLVLHGTHPVSDDLFKVAIRRGVAKINLNRTVRDPYTGFVAANAGSLELTALKERSVEVYAKSIERMLDVIGSSGQS
ncbi:uncharacterized protein K452DRAFT_280955 [Aplosporella prunicola CBS 121167]|uniref:Fructose-bisphosphate aldolase n=1 Tax=Aplosporella prunicola CBS 121167 TaxID=1176127 RepID=A0A6A6AXY9_9PEZI|nr:uncharacterized protein K452DRAFT_280955 [Aplosporella prunicola CBS 121167]KAF2135834.1 hypothetical protein K452DRAFT_280955 [Aplosporella prunicola CBS 121167]